VPVRFRGWNFTQVSGGRAAQMRVRAKSSTVVYAATALSQRGVDLSGWEREGSVFYYNDAGRTQMTVIRKRLTMGQEIEVPQGNWSGVILLFPR
jgi:hypothetical protein